MIKERSEEMIEQHARHLHAVYIAEHKDRLPTRTNHLWICLSDSQREGWRRLARAVPGVIHHEEATSGGFATAPQADTIRELRAQFADRIKKENSFIGTTRPYGEMAVFFEVAGAIEASATIWIGYLIHPDGAFEDLHRESVS